LFAINTVLLKNVLFGRSISRSTSGLEIAVDDLNRSLGEILNSGELDDVDAPEALAEPGLFEYVDRPLTEIVGRFGR